MRFDRFGSIKFLEGAEGGFGLIRAVWSKLFGGGWVGRICIGWVGLQFDMPTSIQNLEGGVGPIFYRLLWFDQSFGWGCSI